MSKFKIGDLVKIGEVRGSKESVNVMYGYKNHVGRITERHPDQEYEHLVKIEGTDGWWFDENILTPYIDNRRFIDAFLGGKEVEALSDTGKWLRLCAITPEIAQLKMRFAKSEEVEVIEKEIESFRAEIETLEKQKKDIDLKIKYAKVRISRREKKLKTLS
jgi:transcription antitermination factor NusG